MKKKRMLGLYLYLISQGKKTHAANQTIVLFSQRHLPTASLNDTRNNSHRLTTPKRKTQAMTMVNGYEKTVNTMLQKKRL